MTLPLQNRFACNILLMAYVLPVLVFGQTQPSEKLEKTFIAGTEALKSGQLEAAVTAFTQAIALSPGFAEAHFNLGLARFQQGQFDLAASSLEKALALKPKMRGANLFLGIANYRQGAYSKAVKALKAETAVDPGNAEAFMWMGVCQLAAGDVNGAAQSLDKASVLKPNDVDILYHRGRAHMLISKQSYEHMYQADPGSWRVHQVLAQSFVESDRLDEAIKECQEAIRLKPNEPGLHEALADVYWKQNQLPNAETEFQNELKLDAGSVSSLYKLAVVSLERSKPAVAADLLTEVLRRQPDSADAHYQLGRAQAQLNQVEPAIGNFSAAVKASGQADTDTLRQSYYQLSQLYRRIQKPDESKLALESFMRLKQQADLQRDQKLQDKMKRSADTSTTVQ